MWKKSKLFFIVGNTSVLLPQIKLISDSGKQVCKKEVAGAEYVESISMQVIFNFGLFILYLIAYLSPSADAIAKAKQDPQIPWRVLLMCS